jgi:hypothetical protein
MVEAIVTDKTMVAVFFQSVEVRVAIAGVDVIKLFFIPDVLERLFQPAIIFSGKARGQCYTQAYPIEAPFRSYTLGVA